MADISFYMLFNENLLNEEKLARMLQEMERRISRQQEAIDRRKREYQEYFTRQEQVKHQGVNKERFQAAISRLKVGKLCLPPSAFVSSSHLFPRSSTHPICLAGTPAINA